MCSAQGLARTKPEPDAENIFFLRFYFFPGERNRVKFLRLCHTLFVCPGFSSPVLLPGIIRLLKQDECGCPHCV